MVRPVEDECSEVRADRSGRIQPVALPFGLLGPLPGNWADDLAAYAERLAAHPWGGVRVKRMVVGDLDASLHTWMPPERYENRLQGARHRSVATGAITFKASDGRCTVAVPPRTDHRQFLVLATHEMGEAALDARQDQVGLRLPGRHARRRRARPLYGVRRRAHRRDRQRRTWMPYATFADSSIVQQLADSEQALPVMVARAVANEQVPVERNHYWFEVIRMYAMARGRADGGSQLAEQDVTDFAARPGFGAELAGFWSGLRDAFDEAYGIPDGPTPARDASSETTDGSRYQRSSPLSGMTFAASKNP
jgi:hypothetical protein